MSAKRDRYYAFDTETVNRPGGGHACLVLAENIAGGVDYLEAPEHFEQIFNFLAPRKYLIAYNAAFDVRAILHTKFLPLAVLNDLATYDCAVYRGFRFFHIPGKYLKCWKPGAGGFEIFDIKSFFQGYSLAKAAEKFLPAARKVDLTVAINAALYYQGAACLGREKVYSQMDKWLRNPKTRTTVINYAAQDVIVLAELYKVLNDSFKACGIENAPLYSPGAVAMVEFGRELGRQSIGDVRNKLFQPAYYGGRIEIAELGRVRGPLNYYDLKSAYPGVIAELPDLATALFRQGTENWKYQNNVKAGAYWVVVEIPTDWQFGPFAYRTKTNIIFPVGKFETWIMRDGIELCRKYKIKFHVLEYYEYYDGIIATPFGEKVRELFKLRKDAKKSLAIKLILNSTYGKMAERDNYNKALPPYLCDIFARYFNADRAFGKYTNFAYAGIITERTRLKLWEAAHKCGAVLLATDGIITRGELSAPGTLGTWDYKGCITEAIILGCGRYELKFKNNPAREYHFRGFSRPARIFEKLRKTNTNYITEKILDTKSLKQWNNAIDKKDFNVLINISKDIYIEDLKRNWAGEYSKLKNYFTGNIKSTPLKMV